MYDAFFVMNLGIWLGCIQEIETKYKTSVLLISPGKIGTKNYRLSVYADKTPCLTILDPG